ncbi:AGTRAP [Bugula neritina]|uniref:AGTRAP n=1 Tax=Bugula neritina TaxID=10212 RepID=A0A7J7KEQ0_BUGNE|nr:AGTRAP [Bugula neritina]
MARIVYDGFLLKVVVLVQIVFSTWGYLEPPYSFFMPVTYGYTHAILIFLGILCIAKPKSSDLVMMYFTMNLFTILNDIILLGLYQPLANNAIERLYSQPATRNTYRFALGMCIVNLILKPVVCFILYKTYLTRGGELPAELCSITVGNGNGNRYDNLDSSVEVASPHQTVDHTTQQV